MKYRIVICVLIYFELAASYPYGEEYIEAEQHPSQHILFSNSAQPQNVPPAFDSQNGFNLESTRPHSDNVAAYRASGVPLETGMDLKPVTQQGQNYNNYELANQRKNLPVQRPLPDQQRLNNDFLENQAKLQNIPQFQPQFADGPNLELANQRKNLPVQRPLPDQQRLNHEFLESQAKLQNVPQFQPQFADGPNLELANQRKNLPVQRPLPDQQRLNHEFLEHQAKLQNVPQFQPQFADGPNLNEVRESYVNPVLRQYQPVSNVEHIEKPAAFRPQYHLNEQYLPLINVPPMQQTSNIQELQNGPVKIREVNSNIGVVENNNVIHLPSDLQTSRLAGDNFQFLFNQPKFKDILATTKNKKRYMIIHPNGEVEHVDSIEDIVAKHPNHLVFNAADINQLRHPSLSSSNIPQSPAIPLKSNPPSSPVILPPTFSSQSTLSSIPRPPAIPFKSNVQSSSGALPPINLPQLTSLNIQQPPAMHLKSDVPLSPVVQPSSSLPQSNISRPPTIPVKSNAPTSSVVLSPTHSPQATSSNISPPPTVPLRTNAQSSSVVKPSTFSSQSTSSNILSQPSTSPLKSSQLSSVVRSPLISSQFTSTLASKPEVVSGNPMSLPLSPDTPIVQKITSETNTKTPSPTSTKPHVSPKQEPLNDLPLTQQLSSTPFPSSDTTKIGVIPDQYPKLTKINSTHPISNVHTKVTQSDVLTAPKKIPIISNSVNNLTPPAQVQNSSSISTTNNEINTMDHLSIVDSNNNKTSDLNVLPAEPSPTAESKINSSAVKIDHSAKKLPLTITEIKSSNNSAVTTSSPSDISSNQNIVSNDIPKKSTLGDKENDFNHSSVQTVPKPVAMISPTPATPFAPIDLADLFPIVKEDNPKIPEVSKSTKKQNETTDSTKLATRKSSIELNHYNIKDENKSSGDSNTVVSTQSDTTISSSDNEKHEVNDAAANVSTSFFAHKERHEDRQESEEINSKSNLSTSNFSQTTEVKSKPEELTNSTANQTTSQIVSDGHAQPVHKNDETLDLPSSLEELSNTDAESTECKIPSIVVDTKSATSSSVDSDESSEQSSIVNADESNHGEENLLDLIQRKKKKNTPTSYDDIWNKLVEDGFVSMVYFIEMPSHYNHKQKEANEHRKQDLQSAEDSS